MRKDIKRDTRRRQGTMDRVLFLLVLVLSFFGVLMVFSASAPYALKQFGDAKYYFQRDFIFTILGVGIMWAVSHIDYRIYRRFAPLIYILAILSCLLVWVPGIAYPVNRAHRWIHLGPLTYMPSDGLKVASLLLLSALLTRKPPEKRGTPATFLAIMLFIGFTILPIYVQPNFSAVIVISAVLLFVYFIYGMNLWHFLPMTGIALVGLAYAFWPKPGNYRLERLLTVFDPMRDPSGSGWQLLQSLYAVASGGFFGVGFGKSVQKFDYLADEPHNDFIFAVISEELGFIGALLVIAGFCFLAVRGIRIARNAKTRFGQVLALGLTFLICFQAMVNIGVSIGLVPTTGITLPFISYGGSSLLVMSMMIGILLNISRDE
ncbi:putative lipid II flippase FtsW [Murdochiella vaginalis]|uniref:putative lipid II flippase FtsW n=1 Tax=Murdochiella vaginalis TaxID=1852373 RepID=UPI0009F6FE10|nr:putative lipid II flippase FtsW [Murdochiella vaginalis]